MATLKRVSKKRHNASERFSYINQLLQEFNVSQNTGQLLSNAKEQILANLANFAYNPINFEHLRRLNVISVFLDNLNNPNKNLKIFAIKGLCNLTSDSQNVVIISNQHGVDKIAECLLQSDDDIIIATLGTLINLQTKLNRPDIIQRIKYLKHSQNKRIVNLVTILESQVK